MDNTLVIFLGNRYTLFVDVLLLGDERLTVKAEAIRPIDAAWKKVAAEMLSLLHEQKGLGLAGPQVGIQKRIFVIHIEGSEPRVFINPSIVATSTETCVYEEGCLSIPNVFADVTRPVKVTVQAWNERGRPFTLEAEGLLARVIQHEYDHLEGILFCDRMSAARKARFLAKYEKTKKAAKRKEGARVN